MTELALHAVIETAWRLEGVPPWPFTAPDADFTRLSDITAAQCGFVMAFIAEYNSIAFTQQTPPQNILHGLAGDDEILIPGGIEIISGERVIRPGCCSGLEEWSRWTTMRTTMLAPFLGHDPDPWLEPLDDGVRIWSDDRDAPAVFQFMVPWHEWDAAVARLRAQITHFVDRLDDWSHGIAPIAAAHTMQRLRAILSV